MTPLNTIIEEEKNAFSNLMLEEYGKWRIDRNVAKGFLTTAMQRAYEAGYKEGRAMMFPRDAIIGMEVHLPDLYHVKVWRLVEYKDYPVEKDV